MRTSTYVLAIIFVVLLAAVLITGQCNKQKEKPELPENYLKADSANVTKIISDHKDGTVTLEKKGNKWYITDPMNYPANPENIDKMLSEIENFELVSLISTNKEKQSVFEVDEEKGVLIEFYNDEQLLDKIILGKMSPAGGVTFVRKPDSDEVYQAEGTIKYVFSKRVRDWRDKDILNIEQESISQIDYNYDDEAFSIVNADTVWILDDGNRQASVAKEKVNKFLPSLSKLKASDFIDDPDTEMLSKFDDPYAMVSVYQYNSPTPHILYFIEHETRYAIKRNQETETIFELYKGNGKRFLKKTEYFLEE